MSVSRSLPATPSSRRSRGVGCRHAERETGRPGAQPERAARGSACRLCRCGGACLRTRACTTVSALVSVHVHGNRRVPDGGHLPVAPLVARGDLAAHWSRGWRRVWPLTCRRSNSRPRKRARIRYSDGRRNSWCRPTASEWEAPDVEVEGGHLPEAEVHGREMRDVETVDLDRIEVRTSSTRATRP